MITNPSYRIIFLCGWYYPDSVGGTEAYVRQLGKELQNLGCTVKVAAPSIDEKEHEYTHDGLPIYRYPVTLEPSKEEVRGAIPPKYLDIFTRWLQNNKPDVVHFHSRTRGCGFYHLQAAKRLGIPCVITIHSADFMCAAGTARLWGIYPCDGKINIYRCTACSLKNRGLSVWWIAWLFSRVPDWLALKTRKLNNRWGSLFSLRRLFIERQAREKILFEYADRVVVVAKWLDRVLKINKIAEQKLYFSPHGLSSGVSKTKRNFASGITLPLRIGYVGRFNPVKGLHILVKAIKALPPEIKVELRIYGRANLSEEKDYLAKVQKLSRKEERIRFRGELTDENRQEVMQDLDIIAVPSIWLETGPYIVLEAFLAGIPVMGSDLGGIAELVTDKVNGMLLAPGNVRAWSKAVKWISQHPEALQNWAASIPSVRNSSAVAQEMLQIYQQIINPS